MMHRESHAVIDGLEPRMQQISSKLLAAVCVNRTYIAEASCTVM